jgi:5-methylcytosine-specific restriction endonuclease McrA
MSEYITCSRCGIVKRGHICDKKKPRNTIRDSKADKFRKTKAWINKSLEIRTRDKYLCVVCINNLYNTINTYNYNKLEVHHITPVNEDYDKRLDNDNLITLCNYHHKMAECGDIPREELYKLIKK